MCKLGIVFLTNRAKVPRNTPCLIRSQVTANVQLIDVEKEHEKVDNLSEVK